MSSPEQCRFCHIEPPERIIRSGELFTSLLSNPKLRKGHVLVVPTRHVENPIELLPNEVTAIFGEIQRVQNRLLGTIAVGCDTWQKYQPFIPEGSNSHKMDHVHFHVIPRSPEDRLFMTPEESQHDVFEPLGDQERDEMVTILREDV